MRRLLVITCLGLMAASCLAQGHNPSSGPHPVQARLLVETRDIRPNAILDIAVVLDMAPHWHTYWAYSGDAGLPTRVQWDLQDGFVAGELRWPGPRRYAEGADLTVFGYADQVALFAQMQTPASLPDTILIGADVSWLVCADICIPGDTTLTWHHVPGEPLPDASGLAAYHPLLPVPLTQADPVRWRHSVQDVGDGVRQVEVHIDSDHGGEELPDFFPLSVGDGAYIEAGPRIQQQETTALSRLEIVPYAGEAPAPGLTGVIGYLQPDGQRQFRSVSIDLENGPSTPQSASIDLLNMVYEEQSDDERGLWTFLLLAMVGGLILNLMPCVLPVISLKVLSLVSQAGSSPTRVRQLGLSFSSGIVVAFLVLAAAVVALQAGGEQLGWGFQFQSPGFVLCLTGLVFLLGLSLFGVVTIRLPGSTASFGGLADGESAGSSFFNGVLATVLATPCTAPFLGAALGFAFSQPALTVGAIFFAAGLGMAMPYLVLAWFPGWMRFLPKPGAWMERFKQGMGFLLMATVLWLMWILGKQLGMEAVVWTGAFLLCLALGAWVLGSWVDLRSSGGQRLAAWATALLLAVVGYAIFLRPLLVQTTTDSATTVITDGEWEAFNVDRVEQHIAAGRTVFIDFTAEWCWTCKVNERTVLADADVRARFRQLDVVLVKADWTSRNSEITDLLRTFGRSGVPLYVIFPGGRPGQPLVLPEVITAGIVLDRLEQAQKLSRG
jgi:thiol:disulfide interchange protein/DsbC/DsbD-like thiol-disulfide interchange protein